MPKIQFFSSHRHLEKNELEVTRGVEDHVEYIAVELALGRRHALEVVHGKGDLVPSRGKGGGRLVESNATQCIDWMREGPCMFSFGNAIEEQR